MYDHAGAPGDEAPRSLNRPSEPVAAADDEGTAQEPTPDETQHAP